MPVTRGKVAAPVIEDLFLELYRRCPHCGGDHLRAVDDGRSANLLCVECRHCWHPDHGSLLRVDPDTCPGCPDRMFCRFPVVGC